MIKYQAIFFCCSYVALEKIISCLSLESGKKILIIVHYKKFYEFLKIKKNNQFLFADIFYLPEFPKLLSFSNFFFVSIILLKLKYIKFLSKIERVNVYFFTVSWGYQTLWAIQYLSKKNNIYYIPAAILKKNTLKKSIFRSFILRLFYGIKHVSFYNYEGQYRSVIDNKFLKKNRVKKISPIKNDQFFFKKSETKKRILILWAQEKHLKIHRAERYGGIIQSIITKYGKYIDIKIHPEDTEINKINFPKYLTVLPTETPASLLVRFYPFIIGYDSSTLFEATKFSNKKIVSLIKIVGGPNVRQKLNYLANNSYKSSKIIFPSEKNLLILIHKCITEFTYK
jgi:hypothetical protein